MNNTMQQRRLVLTLQFHFGVDYSVNPQGPELGFPGPDDYVPARRDDRNQESNQGCLGDISQVQAGADIEKLHAQTSTPAVRLSDTPRTCYASGRWTPTKEHERMIQSTQRKMIRLIIQTKRRYKKIVKQKVKTNEEKDTTDLSSTGDGSEDGQSSNTHKENLTESSSQINKTWTNTGKDRGRLTLLKERYTMTSEERQEK